VRVQGTIAAKEGVDGNAPTFSVVDAAVEPVEQPKDPYLY
jgi:uncharacterized membrane protein YcgQ (UPF0703/DUF1980 family)